MQKFLLIIIILVILFLFYKFTQTSEEFENTPTQNLSSSINDNNSINTLSDISKQLMKGSLTVPGNMTITGDTTIKGNQTNNQTITGNLNANQLTLKNGIWVTSADGKNRLLFDNGGSSFGSSDGSHFFRTSDNNVNSDIVTINKNGLQINEGRLLIYRNGMKADGGTELKKITGTNNIDDCTTQCLQQVPLTSIVTRQKDGEKNCYCKDGGGHIRVAYSNWETMITL